MQGFSGYELPSDWKQRKKKYTCCCFSVGQSKKTFRKRETKLAFSNFVWFSVDMALTNFQCNAFSLIITPPPQQILATQLGYTLISAT